MGKPTIVWDTANIISCMHYEYEFHELQLKCRNAKRRISLLQEVPMLKSLPWKARYDVLKKYD